MKFEEMLREWSKNGSVYLTYDTPNLLADVIAAVRKKHHWEDMLKSAWDWSEAEQETFREYIREAEEELRTTMAALDTVPVEEN